MKVQAKTVAQVLLDALTQHAEGQDPDLPQYAGKTDGTEANAVEVALIVSNTPGVRLTLSDGSKFRIEVHAC